MRVVVRTLPDGHMEDRDFLIIELDGSEVFNVSDGESEDNSLGRNFSDCFQVPNLIERVHEAGRRGEKLDITWIYGEE